jgi:hypothetical protein
MEENFRLERNLFLSKRNLSMSGYKIETVFCTANRKAKIFCLKALFYPVKQIISLNGRYAIIQK